MATVAACSTEDTPAATTAAGVSTTAPAAATEPSATTTTLLAIPSTSEQPEPTSAPSQDRAIAAELAGRWEGVTRIVDLGELPIAVTFAVSDGELGAAMDIQGNIGLELTNVRLDGQRIHFELESPLGLATWDGEVRDGVINSGIPT